MKDLLEYIRESISRGKAGEKYSDIHGADLSQWVRSHSIEDLRSLMLDHSGLKEMNQKEDDLFYGLDNDLDDPNRFKKMKKLNGRMVFYPAMGEAYLIVDDHLIRMMYGCVSDSKYHYCNMTQLDTKKLESDEEQVFTFLCTRTNLSDVL